MGDSLGEFTANLVYKIENGWPNTECVMCGNTTRVLHPVDRAWACSRCHNPVDTTTEQATGEASA